MLSKIQINFGTRHTNESKHSDKTRHADKIYDKKYASKPGNTVSGGILDVFIRSTYIRPGREKFINEIYKTPQGSGFSDFENGIRNNEDIIASFKKDGIALKYSRKDFIANLDKMLSKASHTRKREILEKLKIEPLYQDFTGKMTGYDGIIDISKLNSKSRTESQIYNECHKFLYQNKANTGNDVLDRALNTLIKGMPEFVNVMGKKQHKSHTYSVDIHSLLVLAKLMNNPEYQKLDEEDKFVLKMTAILHDIGKKETKRDYEHPYKSYKLTDRFIQKFDLKPHLKTRILDGVKNHQWLQYYNNTEDKKEAAKQIIKDYTNPNDYKMALIIARADLAATSGHVYELFSNALDEEPQTPLRKAVAEKFNTKI